MVYCGCGCAFTLCVCVLVCVVVGAVFGLCVVVVVRVVGVVGVVVVWIGGWLHGSLCVGDVVVVLVVLVFWYACMLLRVSVLCERVCWSVCWVGGR